MTNPLYDTLFGAHQKNAATFLRLADGTQISYQAFLEMGSQFANLTQMMGLTPGDRVAVQVENHRRRWRYMPDVRRLDWYFCR